MGKILAAALFLLLPIQALAAAPPELPRGEIIPKIVCAGQPDRSYALYLPSSYRPDRKWPIVYAFDSRGIHPDKNLIELLKPGAERFGMIVVSSNDSSNTVPMEENFRSLSALWTDSHGRLAIDDRRAYGFAFSGMSRFLVTAALRAPGTFAGIVGASGGYPLGQPPSKKETPFPYFAMVGEKDFNYYELLDLESRLAAAGLPHRLEVFEGSHQWPSEELVTQSLGWLELQSMKRGTREKDPALVEALWQEDLARARALEAAGKTWRAGTATVWSTSPRAAFWRPSRPSRTAKRWLPNWRACGSEGKASHPATLPSPRISSSFPRGDACMGRPLACR